MLRFTAVVHTLLFTLVMVRAISRASSPSNAQSTAGDEHVYARTCLHELDILHLGRASLCSVDVVDHHRRAHPASEDGVKADVRYRTFRWYINAYVVDIIILTIIPGRNDTKV